VDLGLPLANSTLPDGVRKPGLPSGLSRPFSCRRYGRDGELSGGMTQPPVSFSWS
jgi:hypothetical protein